MEGKEKKEEEKVEKVKKTKKKPNIILYTALMILCFFVLTELVIWGYASGFVLESILHYSQGYLIVSEAVLSALILVVVLIFGNSYIFTQKREKLSKGLLYGLFFIICSFAFMLAFRSGFHDIHAVFNILLGCFLIGVAEEFLCRGWLLNEFLERFGDTKKGVWYSIIISGVIFGIMHLGNIYTMGQDIPTTIRQVISAAATGIVFGTIYYKTKNIWSVVILHGLWDFALTLNDISPVTSNTASIPSFSAIIFILSTLASCAELIILIPYIKDIDGKPDKGFIVGCSFAAFAGFFIITFAAAFLDNSEIGDTYTYDSISLSKYSVLTDNYDEYYMNNNGYSFVLTKKKGNLVLTNRNTNYSVTIECESLYDYIIMEERDYYVLAYVDYTEHTNPYLFYKYIMKDTLSDDNSFVDGISNNIKKYLLSERSELMVVGDREHDMSYLAAYDADYGYYLLTADGKMAILNRDN